MNDAAHRDEKAPRADAAGESGEWIMPPVSYVNPGRRFCALCGRPIARRYWQVTTAGAEDVFCDPAHASLYTTYPMRTQQ